MASNGAEAKPDRSSGCFVPESCPFYAFIYLGIVLSLLPECCLKINEKLR
jgi:hypothetical protein